VYSTFKAIEDNDPYQQQRWLLYWAGSNYSSTYISLLKIVKSINSFSVVILFYIDLIGIRLLVMHATLQL